ncbi:hypothetical protein I7I48_07834 [Histoplasma ohiense]|nr:hypothetical protein I7I48_07834 [Histoplasma ohiense (nom. inval.)]
MSDIFTMAVVVTEISCLIYFHTPAPQFSPILTLPSEISWWMKIIKLLGLGCLTGNILGGILTDYWEYAQITRPPCQMGDLQTWMNATAPQKWDISSNRFYLVCALCKDISCSVFCDFSCVRFIVSGFSTLNCLYCTLEASFPELLWRFS